MVWEIESEPEVGKWLEGLSDVDSSSRQQLLIDYQIWASPIGSDQARDRAFDDISQAAKQRTTRS